MVHGLVEDWQFPYWMDFDRAVDKKLFDEVIINMETLAGINVLASTCDQGGSNDGLRGKLGISEDQLSYQNPAYPDDPERVVFFLHDYVHVEKLWRNNLLDHIVTLENGLEIDAKKEFQELFDFCRANEISMGSYLKDILLQCQSSDRQTVKYAVNLMNNKTASLLRQYFSHDPKKMALADMCDAFHNGQLHSEF